MCKLKFLGNVFALWSMPWQSRLSEGVVDFTLGEGNLQEGSLVYKQTTIKQFPLHGTFHLFLWTLPASPMKVTILTPVFLLLAPLKIWKLHPKGSKFCWLLWKIFRQALLRRLPYTGGFPIPKAFVFTILSFESILECLYFVPRSFLPKTLKYTKIDLYH